MLDVSGATGGLPAFAVTATDLTVDSNPAVDLTVSSSPSEPQTISAAGVSTPLTAASTQVLAPAAAVLNVEPADRAAAFDAMYTTALLPDAIRPSLSSLDSPVSFGRSGDLRQRASNSSTGLGTGSRRLEILHPARRLSHQVTVADVDLVFTKLTDDIFDRREHDHLAIDLHARHLDPVWDDAFLAVVASI